MKLSYFAETGPLSIQLRDKASTETEALSDYVTIDKDEAGEIVAIDIEHVRNVVALGSLDAFAIPYFAAG